MKQKKWERTGEGGGGGRLTRNGEQISSVSIFYTGWDDNYTCLDGRLNLTRNRFLFFNSKLGLRQFFIMAISNKVLI